MASYRYERDIDPKDIAPRKERQYTRKERWANWWDYNLKWVIIIGIAVAFLAYNFIGQYFFTTQPDYNIALISPHYLPEDTISALQDTIAAYGTDCNGDGKVVVKVNMYTVDFAGSSAEGANTENSLYLAMAGNTKLSTDIQSSLSAIYILYDPEGFWDVSGILLYLDGTPADTETSSDWWNTVYHWTDCPVLAGLELGDYGPDTTQSRSGSSQDVMSHYYVGLRGSSTAASVDLLKDSTPLWEALTAGAVSTVTPEG